MNARTILVVIGLLGLITAAAYFAMRADKSVAPASKSVAESNSKSISNSVSKSISEPAPTLTLKKALDVSTDELTRLGATEDETRTANDLKMDDLKLQNKVYVALMTEFFAMPGWATKPFRLGSDLKFPDKLNLGAISIGGARPVFAAGKITAPLDKTAVLYFSWAANRFPQVLRKFTPSDLTGLEISCKRADLVIDEIAGWKRLRHLSFFNSLLKGLSKFESFDESCIGNDQLPRLERFASLKSLGLCGHNITGRAVLEMPLLKRLEELHLKHIEDFQPLLESLPVLSNLRELSLINLDTTDEQLETLSNMPNLSTLRVLRSKLSPDSAVFFSRFPSLKKLILDRNNWSADEKAEFKAQLKGCDVEFQPMLDNTYWKVISLPSL